MVTKVVTENDVDNVTIVVNARNQLESQVVIEEVAGLTMPMTLTKDGKKHPVTKVGKLAGTDWLVFQVGGALETDPNPTPTTDPNPTPTKETIRIPTSVLVKDMSDDTHVWAGEHKHRIAYILTPENNEAFKAGTVNSNAVLTFNMLSGVFSYRTTKDVTLPTNAKGEFELHIDYEGSDSTSEIESATASGAITVETEDKIYMYELVSPVTVVKRGEVDPSRSFTAEVNCGEYTWEEQPDYRYGTAIQPATVTLSSNDFTADDIQKVTLYTKRLDSEDELWIYETEEINSMVISIPEWTDEVHNPDYVTVTTVEVLLKDGLYVRANVRAECPITK